MDNKLPKVGEEASNNPGATRSIPKLGPVGAALLDKIKEKQTELSPEEIKRLEEMGYVVRGTGFANKKTGKFVSNKEIDAALGDRNKDVIPVTRVESGDAIYDVVSSIKSSIDAFADLILERGEEEPPIATPVDSAGAPRAPTSAKKQIEKPADGAGKIDDIPIYKKIKALAGIAAVFLFQVAYPIYLKVKEMFEATKIWVDKARLIFEEKVLSFFTVDIPRYVEDIKDFFVVKVPSYFAQFTDAISVSIQNILDIPKEVLYAMEGFALSFGQSVIESVSPWISKIGIDLDAKNEELKRREKELDKKKATLSATQAAREKELEQKTRERVVGRQVYDAEKEAARQLEDRKRQEEFDKRRKELEDKQRALDAKKAPPSAPPAPPSPGGKPVTPPMPKEKGSGDEGMVYPPPGKKQGMITSPFGYRIAPAGKNKGTRQFHPGIDVAGVPSGSPIHTLAEGKVIKAGSVGSYGNMVDLQVGSRVYRFAHLDEIFVKAGDVVPKNGVIGTLGNTGVGTGPHLHFEDRDKSSFMDGQTATQDPLQSEAYSLIAVGNRPYKKPPDATAAAPMGGMTDGGPQPTTAAAEKKSDSKKKKGKAEKDAELVGKGKIFAAALRDMGFTSTAAIQAILATAIKESGLDPKSKEYGPKSWLGSLKNRGVKYVYEKFPQLRPGGRVATALGYKSQGVPEDVLREKFSTATEKEFFEFVYGGSSTNPKPGDGYLYRGRGFIQITGRTVYKAVGDIIGIDLESNPDLVASDFSTASKAVAAYLLNSINMRNPQKALQALNSITDYDTALKIVVGNAAQGGLGLDKSKVEAAYTTGSYAKTNVGQLEAAKEKTSIAMAAISGMGTQVAAATQAADIKPPPPKPPPTKTASTTPQKTASLGSGGKNSPPNSDYITRGYKEHFGVS